MQRKLRPFRNYALRRAFRFALHRIRVIERIAAPDCSAPADQEAHLSSNILFGVAISITPLARRLASHRDLEVKRRRRKPSLLGNNLIYPLHRIYTEDLPLKMFISTFLCNLRRVEIDTLGKRMTLFINCKLILAFSSNFWFRL